jgi:hypothetical protein
MSSDAPRPISPAGAALLVAVIAAGLWLGMRGPQPDGVDDARAATLAGGTGAGVVALPVRTIDGATASLTAGGRPTVVMVSSETCTFCKAALNEMGRVAAGRPLDGLRVVTLEGAAAGLPMLQAANVAGATLAGPASAAAAAHWTFQIQGTPMFVALDEQGRVTKTMVGYLGAGELKTWIEVALGERGRP